MHYIKFFQYYLFALFCIGCIAISGWAIPLGFATYLVVYVLGDAYLGDDLSEPPLMNKMLINILLYGSVPLTLLIFTALLWLVTPYDFAPSSQAYQDKLTTPTWQKLIAIPFLGLVLSSIATVVAHELVHRVNSQVAVTTGRWLLAFSFDANFSIEHVFNHHVKVATDEDPVTAPRGRNVYTHFIYALINTNRASWRIEKSRLAKQRLSIWSLRNQYLTGWGMSIVLLAIAFGLASWQGVLIFIATGLFAKFILEVVNYMEHYGLVRDPKQPVRPRHSWNSNRRMSCYAMFNLPRHSHHHAQGAVPFEKLKAMPEAPLMIAGYITTIGYALVPPLWFKLMKPKLAHWDEYYANDKERALLGYKASSL